MLETSKGQPVLASREIQVRLQLRASAKNPGHDLGLPRAICEAKQPIVKGKIRQSAAAILGRVEHQISRSRIAG
jgi:hypothetical protein